MPSAIKRKPREVNVLFTSAGRRVELLRAVMEHYGDSAKPVYITESGWNDDPRWTYAVRPGQRILYTVAAL